ncbi:MAG: prolipoprotein diacylglyceryl transferase [Dehalococcoidia bacterium]
MLSSLLTIEIPLGPTIFEVAGLEITWHGLFTALGVVAGVMVAAFFARRAGYPQEVIYNVSLALVIGGIIGARGLFVIENWDRFQDDFSDVFAVNTGGISLFGALIGGLIGAVAYSFWAKVPNKWRGADLAVLGAIIGMAVGRIGDIINGEHFARATDWAIGVRYTDADSPSFDREPQHLAVGYELVGDLLIFLVLLLVYRRSGRDGLTLLAWAFLYSAMRLGLSFLREDDIVWAGLRTAQIIAIVVMILSVLAFVYLVVIPPPAGPTRAERRRTIRAERRRATRGGAST